MLGLRRRPVYILYRLTATHLLDWPQLETDRTHVGEDVGKPQLSPQPAGTQNGTAPLEKLSSFVEAKCAL